MTDRELLELAAKAAGIELRFPSGIDNDISPRTWPGLESWNPLTDDGDAFRLAVALDIGVQSHSHPHGDYSLAAYYTASSSQNAIAEKHRKDKHAATRRAIVRAAAEIGRTMP